MIDESTSLNTSNRHTLYDSFDRNHAYESDGESVSSYNSLSNRYLIMSPDTDYDELIDNYSANELTLPTTVRKELRYILTNSVLITLTCLMEYSLTIISLFVIGHVCDSSDALASASLAVMTYNIMGLAFVEGMATALDTFCSQAYGARRYTKVGLYAMRCAMMIMTGIIPVLISWWFSASWLGYIIPEENIIPQIQLFLRILSFGMPGLIIFETGKRFLQAQGHFQAGTYALLITVPLNIFLVYVLTRTFGFPGAPFGIVLSQWFMGLLLILYCTLWERDTLLCMYPLFESRFHFKRLFSSWKPMWHLAFPGLLMIEAEYLSFEVLTVMSTYLGVEAIAAQSIVSNIGSLAYQVPFAMGCVVSTRVANYIGTSSVNNARRAIKTSYIVALFVGIFNFCLILFGNRKLASLFTKDSNIVEITSHVSPILAVNQLYDSFTTFGAAILRSQGRQRVGSILNIIAYYLIALPLSGWFTFGRLHLGLKGLWYGCGIGILVLSVVFTYCVCVSDWTSIVEECQRREKEENELDLESLASNISLTTG